MEDFQPTVRTPSPQDKQDRNIEKVLAVKKSVNLIESDFKDRFSATQLRSKDISRKMAAERTIFRVYFWSFVTICTTANIYGFKKLVKVLRKVPFLKSYWSIQFAACAPLLAFNFVCVGYADGLLAARELEEWVYRVPLTEEETVELAAYNKALFLWK